ncbi:MAG: histidine--tRNA ligase [Casimicrobiaceae bacterium]|nr:histidine--tRNA ligase [Casimicrobiaceae bacterium]MDW8312403.1 histidine--tRNA ligase [Burkholderiales bacterium]
MDRIQAVRGMHDLLPEDSAAWEHFEQLAASIARAYGYRNMRTPIVEHTPLFVRSIGAVTDIVEKEMYSFEDRLNGEALTLRPEITAGLVRAAIEANLTYPGPQRVYSMGPVFRHERPQKGRYRQFHQFDVEAFGFEGPDIDAELMLLAWRILRALGLNDVRLEINSIGNPPERAAYRAKLIAHYERHLSALDEEARRRLYSNPMRILDSKVPSVIEVNASAPSILDALEAESRAHFESVQALLAEAGVPFVVNPRIVRGLDYYNRTTFEFVSEALGSPLTVCAGGRYDGLFEQLGGKPTPAIGFGMGIERVLMLAAPIQAPWRPDAYIVHAGEAASRAARRLAEQLRDEGFAVILHAGGGSFKSQMKKADASGARFALILGDEEAATGRVSLKPLRDASGQAIQGVQVIIQTSAAPSYLRSVTA